MFSRLTIGKRLTLSCGVLLASVLGLSYFSLSGMSKLHDDLDQMEQKTLVRIELVGDIKAAVSQVRAENRGMILGASAKKPADLAKSHQGGRKVFDQLDGYVKNLRPLLLSESGQRLNEQLAVTLPLWHSAFEQIAQALSPATSPRPIRSAPTKSSRWLQLLRKPPMYC